MPKTNLNRETCEPENEILDNNRDQPISAVNAQRIQHERRQIQHLHEEQDEARRIQQNLLPRTAPSLPGFQLEAECVPAGAVGGDWYDYIPLADGRLALVLAVLFH